jgi:hypothetical protein
MTIRMKELSSVSFNVILPSDLLVSESGVLNETELRYKFISYNLPPFFNDEDLVIDSPYLTFDLYDASVESPLFINTSHL